MRFRFREIVIDGCLVTVLSVLPAALSMDLPPSDELLDFGDDGLSFGELQPRDVWNPHPIESEHAQPDAVGGFAVERISSAVAGSHVIAIPTGDLRFGK